ncbi:MAG TPA: capsular polysaccharide synthesis protein [Saprospiraceae bacterium]|nr:capsular polysaccharide synthesis protein [Saprospiraceae bacterium]
MERIIWMLWFQGWDKAPVLVQLCRESWQRLHPDWKIVLLDENNLKEYVDIDPIIARNVRHITPQARANIVRINLLRQYGGVWVDATCFCRRSLNSWLPEVMTSGFFAFRDPGPDRIMSNWFLASEKDCYLTNTLCEAVNAYWRENTFSGRLGLRKLFLGYYSKNTKRTDLWFHWMITKGLKIFPFFWFHYLFARTARNDRQFRQIWERTPYRPADPIHAVYFYKQSRMIDEQMRGRLMNGDEPLYKLSWKRIPRDGIVEGSVLDFLFTHMMPEKR